MLTGKCCKHNFTASSVGVPAMSQMDSGAREQPDDKRKVSIYLNLFRIMNQKSVLSLVVSCRFGVVSSGLLLFMEAEGEQDHEFSL
jgi:hypothetical protein